VFVSVSNLFGFLLSASHEQSTRLRPYPKHAPFDAEKSKGWQQSCQIESGCALQGVTHASKA
jgi:hypothetical protein